MPTVAPIVTGCETRCMPQPSPESSILGGDVRIWRDGNTFTAIEAYESVFAFRFKLYIEQHGFSGTGNLAIKRSDFAKVGPFVGINFAEDMEWGQRACRAGFRFRYTPEMIVFHPARRSLHELYAKWDRTNPAPFEYGSRESLRGSFGDLRCAIAILGSPVVDLAKIVDSDRIEGLAARVKAMTILVANCAHRARKMLSLLRESKTVVRNCSAGA